MIYCVDNKNILDGILIFCRQFEACSVAIDQCLLQTELTAEEILETMLKIATGNQLST